MIRYKNRAHITLVINFFWIIFCFIFFAFLDEFNLNTLMGIILFQFFGNLIILKFNGFSPLSFVCIFEIFSFVFHCGQVVLEYFNISAERPFDIFYLASTSSLEKSFKFYIGIKFFLIFGILFVKLFKKKKAKLYLQEDNLELEKNIYNTGLIIFLIGLFPRLYIDIYQFILFFQSGYLETFNTGINGYVQVLSYCFQIGAMLIIIGKHRDVKVARNWMIFITLYLILTMLKGGRATQITYIVGLFCLYFKIVRKPNFRKIIFLLCIGYLGLVFVSVIGNIRTLGVEGFEDFTEIFMSSLSLNVIWDTLGEFGGTAITLCYAIEFFPQVKGFAFGVPYVTSFFSVFPNVGGVIDKFQKSWIYIDYFPKGNRFALGGSFIGELYYNFGFIGGILVAFILGIILGCYSDNIDEAVRNKKLLKLAILMTPFASLLIWTRGYFSDMVRQFIWITFLIWFIFKEIQYRNNKVKKN